MTSPRTRLTTAVAAAAVLTVPLLGASAASAAPTRPAVSVAATAGVSKNTVSKQLTLLDAALAATDKKVAASAAGRSPAINAAHAKQLRKNISTDRLAVQALRKRLTAATTVSGARAVSDAAKTIKVANYESAVGVLKAAHSMDGELNHSATVLISLDARLEALTSKPGTRAVNGPALLAAKEAIRQARAASAPAREAVASLGARAASTKGTQAQLPVLTKRQLGSAQASVNRVNRLVALATLTTNKVTGTTTR